MRKGVKLEEKIYKLENDVEQLRDGNSKLENEFEEKINGLKELFKSPQTLAV